MKPGFSLPTLVLATSLTALSYSVNFPVAQAQQLPALEESFSDSAPLKPGDQLRLTVIGFPDVSGPQTVLSDGGLQIPLAGYINVWGLTPNQATETISAALLPYIRRPQVSLAIERFSPTRISVTGAVVKSGPLVLDTPAASLHGATTLSDVLTLAGGVMPNADIGNIIIRRNTRNHNNSTSSSISPQSFDSTSGIQVDLWQSISDGDLSADIPIYDGDEIIVPISTQTAGVDQQVLLSSSVAPVEIAVNVGGEVSRPGVINIPPNSDVTSAVTAAGGITTNGSSGNIILLRTAADGTIDSYVYGLGEESIALSHGDSIIVSQSSRSQVSSFLRLVSGVLNPFAFLLGVFD